MKCLDMSFYVGIPDEGQCCITLSSPLLHSVPKPEMSFNVNL